MLTTFAILVVLAIMAIPLTSLAITNNTASTIYHHSQYPGNNNGCMTNLICNNQTFPILSTIVIAVIIIIAVYSLLVWKGLGGGA